LRQLLQPDIIPAPPNLRTEEWPFAHKRIVLGLRVLASLALILLVRGVSMFNFFVLVSFIAAAAVILPLLP
jgi:hypothetical protein